MTRSSLQKMIQLTDSFLLGSSSLGSTILNRWNLSRISGWDKIVGTVEHSDEGGLWLRKVDWHCSIGWMNEGASS